MLHKAIIRENLKQPKYGRVVYDAPAKCGQSNVLLKDFLETGPSLKNSLRNVLLRSRFEPILLCGDIHYCKSD